MPAPLLRGKKLGLLLSAPPDQPAFSHALRLAQTALDEGVRVYLYCMDDAVAGLAEPALQDLKRRGLSLYACAYAARKRRLPINDLATFAGLGSLVDLIVFTDRFAGFN